MNSRRFDIGAHSGDAIVPDAYPILPDAIPRTEIKEGNYIVRFAQSRAELDAVLKLRFEVFNIELGEGLESSHRIGRDVDEFDASCHHLIAGTLDGRVVGTYRVQTAEMASSGNGYYSAGEFDLSKLPQGVLGDSLELGRACIAADHRNTQVLFLLWKGLAQYLIRNQRRYLFGCCSLSSQDPNAGLLVSDTLRQSGNFHPDFLVPARPGFECSAVSSESESREVSIPKLFRTYLRFGAKVCSAPALDRRFKTIDFLVMLDLATMDEHTRSLFFNA